MRLGIDLGTTRTVVAAELGGRYAVASFEADGGYRDWLPGLAVVRDGALLFGWDAAAALDGPVDGAVRSIKRLVSSRAPDDPVPELPGADLTALELASRFLEHVRLQILDASNLEVTSRTRLEATVAVPANAGSGQRFLTLEAFGRAGFAVRDLVNEPTAAAVEFAHRNRTAVSEKSPKRYVVVYDLGGGTFDTSAVSLDGRRFELLGTEGIARLGGDDFDAAILEAALEAAGVDPSEPAGAERTALLEACRAAKETLGPSSRRLLVDLGGYGEVVLDTAALYARCEPLVARTTELVQRIFDGLPGHGLDPENLRELGGLYLVGGSVAFPPVARALRARWGRKIQLASQPHAATAVGLAVLGDPEAGLFVREATTRHFGVWREADSGRVKVFDPLLTKGTVPTGERFVLTRIYHPTHSVGHLRYLECGALGPEGEPDGDVHPWKPVYFPYDPALADHPHPETLEVRYDPHLAHEEVAETYTYGRDGRVTVTIENLGRGYKRTFTLGRLG